MSEIKPKMTDIRHFTAFGFGSGLSPIAPGTMGTVAAIPIYLLLVQTPISVYLLLTVIICVGGVWICESVSNDLGVHDHGGIVLDEIAGFLITMIALPVSWEWIIAGFILFRLFDIWKPWPIGWADKKVSGGLGIMLDDIIAGGMAAIILNAVNIFYF